ncbi:MAG: hypothetical protein GZ094_20420 [Mariniphaga sp.]|nr:hypothetical protein [Mariniphaga sp.]
MIKDKSGYILFVLLILLFSSCNRHIVAQKQVNQYTYYCPMHVYVTDQPGKCPKCGMSLERMDLNKLPAGNSDNIHSSHTAPVGGGHSGHSGH